MYPCQYCSDHGWMLFGESGIIRNGDGGGGSLILPEEGGADLVSVVARYPFCSDDGMIVLDDSGVICGGGDSGLICDGGDACSILPDEGDADLVSVLARCSDNVRIVLGDSGVICDSGNAGSILPDEDEAGSTSVMDRYPS